MCFPCMGVRVLTSLQSHPLPTNPPSRHEQHLGSQVLVHEQSPVICRGGGVNSDISFKAGKWWGGDTCKLRQTMTVSFCEVWPLMRQSWSQPEQFCRSVWTDGHPNTGYWELHFHLTPSDMCHLWICYAAWRSRYSPESLRPLNACHGIFSILTISFLIWCHFFELIVKKTHHIWGVKVAVPVLTGWPNPPMGHPLYRHHEPNRTKQLL